MVTLAAILAVALGWLLFSKTESNRYEAARKVAAKASIITGVSMLVGAFIACVAAAFGAPVGGLLALLL